MLLGALLPEHVVSFGACKKTRSTPFLAISVLSCGHVIHGIDAKKNYIF